MAEKDKSKVQADALARYKETGEVGEYEDPGKDEHSNDNVVFPPGVDAHAVNVSPDKTEDSSAEALGAGRPDLRGTGNQPAEESK